MLLVNELLTGFNECWWPFAPNYFCPRCTIDGIFIFPDDCAILAPLNYHVGPPPGVAEKQDGYPASLFLHFLAFATRG
jgi:hypothetical protein